MIGRGQLSKWTLSAQPASDARWLPAQGVKLRGSAPRQHLQRGRRTKMNKPGVVIASLGGGFALLGWESLINGSLEHSASILGCLCRQKQNSTQDRKFSCCTKQQPALVYALKHLFPKGQLNAFSLCKTLHPSVRGRRSLGQTGLKPGISPAASPLPSVPSSGAPSLQRSYSPSRRDRLAPSGLNLAHLGGGTAGTTRKLSTLAY